MTDFSTRRTALGSQDPRSMQRTPVDQFREPFRRNIDGFVEFMKVTGVSHSTSDSVEGLRDDLNQLIDRLRAGGLLE